MTFRTSINSKENPRDLLKRGFKSMFPSYEEEVAVPPANVEQKRKKQPSE
ncbi:MAG: hypothetical protein JEY79_07080 [Pseudodesulfovibrio sp.]|nr:hypothetical protein [Pseudodesulfovibrio sp.]